ncbi:hypothetical protein Leryth_011617, partial [Lithospermum erythrorhizon]
GGSVVIIIGPCDLEQDSHVKNSLVHGPSVCLRFNGFDQLSMTNEDTI